MSMKINNPFHAIVPDASGNDNAKNTGAIKSPNIREGLNVIKRNEEPGGKQDKKGGAEVIGMTAYSEKERFWSQKRKEAWTGVSDEVKNVDDKFSCFAYAIGNIAGVRYDEESEIGFYDYDKQAKRFLNQYAEMYDEVNRRYDEGGSYFVTADGRSRSIDRAEALHGLSLKLEQKLTGIDINRMGRQDCLEEDYKRLEIDKQLSNRDGRIAELMDDARSNMNLVKKQEEMLPESICRVGMEAAEEYAQRKKEGTGNMSITDIFNGKI